jgi:lambda family phage portal protein
MTAPYLKIVDSRGNAIPTAALYSDYEGAATGRRMSSWGVTTRGPNASLYQSLNRLRSRSRELARNNPLIDGGLDTFAANIVGSGISPRWQLNDPALKKQIQELWNDWVEEADFYGLCDFYGLQTLGSRALMDAGEFLVRFIPMREDDGLSVPLQLQFLEADHLDETFNSIYPQTSNEIRMGIEIDDTGRRVAYHLFREHPGEAFLTYRNQLDRVRIPADQIIHVYRPLRIGQMRGRPWLASILVKLHELDQYEDAELVRKKTAAMFGGFIHDDVPSGMGGMGGMNLGRSIGQDVNLNTVIAIEPGTFPFLPAGKKVTFSQPVDVGGTYDVWIKQQLREIAVGMGVTYEQLTSDLSGVNYSSIRAGLLEFRRRCSNLQFQTMVFQLCRPVSRAWMDSAVLSGALSIQGYFPNRRIYRRIKWRPDGWPWVDPVKDQLAEQMSVRNGFKSRAQVIAERGGDIETVDQEIAEDNARADKLGLVYDSDPRKTAGSGSVQNVVAEVLKETLNPDGKGDQNG